MRFAVRSILKGGAARLVVIPISALLGIVNTRLIIEHYGQSAYAQYGLLVNVISLLPFADLGVSAAVMNAMGASDDPRSDPKVHRVLVTALRVLFGSMLTLIGIALLLLGLGAWPSLLGAGLIPGSGPTVATLCLVAIGLGLPIGSGQRILIGVHKNHLNVLLLGLQTPVMLVLLLAITSTTRGDGSYLAVLPYAVTLLLSLTILALAAHYVRPMFGRSVRDAVRLRTVRGGGVLAVAWPTLLQMIALPIAMQTDRLILSHVASVASLAEYNLAATMFVPIWGVVNAGGVALWPIFAKARARGDTSLSPTRLALGFGAAATVVTLVIASAAPWLAATASDHSVHLPTSLIVSFAIFMVLQALKFPLGMYMTDPRGLRYQAYMIILLLPVNLGLSLVLAERIGAAGPVIGSAVGVFFCQVLANWIWVRRDLSRRGTAPDAGPAPRPVVGRHRR